MLIVKKTNTALELVPAYSRNKSAGPVVRIFLHVLEHIVASCDAHRLDPFAGPED